MVSCLSMHVVMYTSLCFSGSPQPARPAGVDNSAAWRLGGAAKAQQCWSLLADCAGSMYGAREVVAKAVVLECMRGAHRQQRRCYLYAFRWEGSRDEGGGDWHQAGLGDEGSGGQC